MSDFKILDFFDESKERGSMGIIHMKAFVPGVNSGAYSKRLHIQIWIKRQVKGFFKVKEEKIYADINLSPKEIEQLRDECNKILKIKKL